MVRKKSYKPKSFESTGKTNDTSANIYESMLLSDAFRDLTTTQKTMYLYMKAQYYGKRKPRQDYADVPQFQHDDMFYFPIEYAEKYHICKKSNQKAFYKNIAAIEEHGFIKTISNGRAQGKKNVYQYSDEWKKWKK